MEEDLAESTCDLTLCSTCLWLDYSLLTEVLILLLTNMLGKETNPEVNAPQLRLSASKLGGSSDSDGEVSNLDLVSGMKRFSHNGKLLSPLASSFLKKGAA
jgi:hypothetical protein